MAHRAKLRALIVALPLSLAAGTALAQSWDDDEYSVTRVARTEALGHRPVDISALPTITTAGRTILAPDGIARAVEQQGFFAVRRIVYTGGVYTALARSEDGVDYTLKIDAETGMVLPPNDGLDYGPRVAGDDLTPPPRIGRYSDRSGLVEKTTIERVVLPFPRVRTSLEALGYKDCNQAGYEQGIFRVEAVNGRGDLVRLTVDAYTGDVLNERVVESFDTPWVAESIEGLRFDTIKRRLESERYRDVDKIKVQGDQIVVKAEDRNGEEVRLIVDAHSGRVIEKDYLG